MKDTILETIINRFMVPAGPNRKPLYRKLISICRNNNYKLSKHHSQILLDLIKLNLEDPSYSPVLNQMVSVLKLSPINYNPQLLQLADYEWFEQASEQELTTLIENLILSDWI